MTLLYRKPLKFGTHDNHLCFLDTKPQWLLYIVQVLIFMMDNLSNITPNGRLFTKMVIHVGPPPLSRFHTKCNVSATSLLGPRMSKLRGSKFKIFFMIDSYPSLTNTSHKKSCGRCENSLSEFPLSLTNVLNECLHILTSAET